MEVVGSQRVTSDDKAGGKKVERVRSSEPTENSLLCSLRLCLM